jgi:hypothetical protein
MVVVRDFFLKAIAQGREVSEPFEREAFLDCSRDGALQDANMGIDELWIRASIFICGAGDPACVKTSEVLGFDARPLMPSASEACKSPHLARIFDHRGRSSGGCR